MRRGLLVGSAACCALALLAGFVGEPPARVDDAPAKVSVQSIQQAGAHPDPARVVAALEGVSAAPAREPRPPSSASARLRALAHKLKAPGTDVEDPCTVWHGLTCERTAMTPFFRVLDDIEDGHAQGHATVATLGNSLIASDHITDVVRERLQERFGDGGRGFVLADRISNYGRRTRSGIAKAGDWTPHNFAMGERGPYPFGVAGVLHVSTRKGARTRWKIDGERRAEVLWLDHEKASGFSLLVDGKEVSRVEPDREPTTKSVSVELPEGAAKLELVADGPGVVSYGAILERAEPGFIWNTFGVPAAGSTTFFEADPAIFQEHLAMQKPSLVVVMLGGNETKRLHWGKRTKEQVERDFARLLDRLRANAPEAACLAIGPIDSVDGDPPDPFRLRHHLPWVIATQRRLALERGCAYLDLFAAMGGSGSLKRFHARGLLHDDLVHPRRAGLDVLGELIADALLRAWSDSPRYEAGALARRTADIAPGLVLAPPALPADAPVLPRTGRALGPRGNVRERFALGVFTDAGLGPIARALDATLAARAGHTGRALGWDEVELSGDATVVRAASLGMGAPVGLAGARVRLVGNAALTVSLDGRVDTASHTALHVAWLRTPTTGRLRVSLDGGAPQELVPTPETAEGPVYVARLPVPEGARSAVFRVDAFEERDEAQLLGLAIEPGEQQAAVAVVDVLEPASLPELGDTQPDVTAALLDDRDHDLLIFAPSEESLTKGAVLESTLELLRRGARRADCLVLAPLMPLASDARLVDDRARLLAHAAGCGFLSTTTRLGGEPGAALWRQKGWLDDDGRFTREGSARFADLLLLELLAAGEPRRPQMAQSGEP